MRSADLLRLAWRTLRGGRAALPALLCAVAVFCGCFAGAVTQQISEEQALPCQLTVTGANGKAISDATLEKARQLPDVLAATAVLPLPVTVTTGVYTAKQTLTAIDGDYLNAPYKLGGVFPGTSAMPYLVLNEAACRQFQQASDDVGDGALDVPTGVGADALGGPSDAQLPNIDWLKAGFALKLGDGRPVVAKVCGVLAKTDKEEQPAVYLSLPAVKELLRQSGQSAAVQTIWLRVRDIGHANAVAQALAALGLTASDDNAAQQSRWDNLAAQRRYLLALAILAQLAALALLAQGQRLLLTEQRPAWQNLRLMGMRPQQIRLMFVLRNMIATCLSAAVAVTVALLLPNFLLEEMAQSLFHLAVPVWAWAWAAAVAVVSGALPAGDRIIESRTS